MHLPEFEVLRPGSEEEALGMLEKHGPGGGVVMAGGTDLLVQMKEGACQPGIVILLDKLKRLGAIENSGGRVSIGALTTFDQIIRSEMLIQKAPVLVEACQKIGSPQIRNRATIGGNIANASPCADSVPALVVLEAEVILKSRSGVRRLKLADCFKGPGENALREDELLTGVEFDLPRQPQNSFYREMGQRKALSITKLSVAGQLELKGNLVKQARIAYGAVAPTVLRGTAVEEELIGKELTPALLNEVCVLAQREVKPISDIRSTAQYRSHATGILLKRGLESLLR